MAKGNEHPWQYVALVERALASMLAHSCDRWFPAGSFRRKTPVCHDLDIVVIPKYHVRTKDLFGGKETISLFDQALEHTGLELRTSGPAKKTTEYRGLEVDFYIATQDNFVMVCFIRTGSAQNNVRLATLAKQQGKKLAYADGCMYLPDGQPVPILDERQIYQLLGEPWQEPEERW